MQGCLDDNAMAAYVDGALTVDEIARVDSHLSVCATCRKDLSAMAVAHTMPIAREPGEDAGELVPGDTIGRYVLSAEHARGGMGIVAIAFDPELGRNIAIKVLRPDLSGQLLRDEARAMAKLSHPNVVSVYDVGEHEGRIYFAMELVEGTNLRRWLAEHRHGWREILRTCVQAGRGLAAAHRVGLVHRDFKPDNVLCGPDDRVRVTDFGLASNLPGATGFGAGSGLAGTPAYIAPEVWRGERATARSDQWSFCATLYEALFGTPPFGGATREDVRTAIERGTLSFPPRRGLPSRVRRVLARGLATDPAARYATLDEMLDELDAITRRSTALWLAVGGIAIVAVAGAGVYALQPRRDLCRIPSSLIDDAWNEARAKQIETAFAATGRKHAADSAKRVRETFDRYRAQWLAARKDACEATRVRGDQSDAMLDARTRCLDRRHAELAEVARMLGDKPTPAVVDHAVQAAHDVTSVDSCSAAGVQAEIPLPSDPQRAAQISALEHELATLRASLTLQTHTDAVMAQAHSIVERARAVNFPPLTARAAVVLARLEMYTTDQAATERRLYDALVATAAAHDDFATAEVWTYLVSFVGGTKADMAAALQLVKPAEAALARAEAPAQLRAQLHHAQALAYTYGGELDKAHGALEQARGETSDPIDQATIDVLDCHVEQRLAHMDKARELCNRAVTTYERELGPHHPDLGFALSGVGMLAFEEHDDAAARAAFERSLDIIANSVGEHHVSYAMGLNNLGMIERHAQNFAAARRDFERAAAALETLHHPDLYSALGNLGDMEWELGHYKEARKYMERTLDIAIATQGEQSDRVSRAYYSLGSLAHDEGDYARAQTMYERALAISSKLFGENHPYTAQALLGLGLVYSSRDDCKRAITYHQRAVASYEAVYGKDHVAVADSLTMLASCQTELGDRHALDNIERALAIRDRVASDDIFQSASTHWTAAKALWKLGGDHQRALVLAKEARELYAKSPDPQAKSEVPVIDRWLAARGAKR